MNIQEAIEKHFKDHQLGDMIGYIRTLEILEDAGYNTDNANNKSNELVSIIIQRPLNQMEVIETFLNKIIPLLEEK